MAVQIRVTSDSRQAQADLRRLEGSLESVQQNTERINKSIGRAGTLIKSAFIALPILAVGSAAVKAAADFERLNVRLGIVTGSLERAGKAFNAVQKIVAKTPFDVRTLTDAYARLASSGNDILKTQRDLERALQNISDAVAAVGGGSQELTQVAEAFEKMAGEGRITARRLEQITSAGIPLIKISERLGLTVEELRAEVEKGNFTFARFYKGFQAVAEAADGFGGAAEKQVRTLNGALSILGDNLTVLADRSLRQSGILKDLTRVILAVADAVGKFSEGIEVDIFIARSRIRFFYYDIRATFKAIERVFTSTSERISGVLPSIFSIDLSRFKLKLTNFLPDFQSVKNALSSFGQFVIGIFANIYRLVIGNSYWPDMIDGIVEYSSKLLGRIKPYFDKFRAYLVNVFQGISRFSKNIFDDFKIRIEVSSNTGVLRDISDFLRKIVKSLEDFVKTARKYTFIQRLFDKTEEFYNKLVEIQRKVDARVWVSIGTAFNAISLFVSRGLSKLFALVGLSKTVESNANLIEEAAKNYGISVKDVQKVVLQEQVNTLRENSDGFINRIKAVFSEGIIFSRVFQSAYEEVGGFIGRSLARVFTDATADSFTNNENIKDAIATLLLLAVSSAFRRIFVLSVVLNFITGDQPVSTVLAKVYQAISNFGNSVLRGAGVPEFQSGIGGFISGLLFGGLTAALVTGRLIPILTSVLKAIGTFSIVRALFRPSDAITAGNIFGQLFFGALRIIAITRSLALGGVIADKLIKGLNIESSFGQLFTIVASIAAVFFAFEFVLTTTLRLVKGLYASKLKPLITAFFFGTGTGAGRAFSAAFKFAALFGALAIGKLLGDQIIKTFDIDSWVGQAFTYLGTIAAAFFVTNFIANTLIGLSTRFLALLPVFAAKGLLFGKTFGLLFGLGAISGIAVIGKAIVALVVGAFALLKSLPVLIGLAVVGLAYVLQEIFTGKEGGWGAAARDWFKTELIDPIGNWFKDMWDGVAKAFREKVIDPVKNFFSRKPGDAASPESGTSGFGFASGGRIRGAGSGTSDSILARLSNGEYVINAASTSKYLPLIDAINKDQLPGFSGGGPIGRILPKRVIDRLSPEIVDAINRFVEPYFRAKDAGKSSEEKKNKNLNIDSSNRGLLTRELLNQGVNAPLALAGLISTAQKESGENLNQLFEAAPGASANSLAIQRYATEFRNYFTKGQTAFISFFREAERNYPDIEDRIAYLSNVKVREFLGSQYKRTGAGNKTNEDGWNFRGRGWYQYTGRDTYSGIGYLNNPDLLAQSVVSNIDAVSKYFNYRSRPVSSFNSIDNQTRLARELNNIVNRNKPEDVKKIERLIPSNLEWLKLQGFASGGRITGPGSGTSDDILARLSNGEYVVNAESTRQNLPLLERINKGLPAFSVGGLNGSAGDFVPEGYRRPSDRSLLERLFSWFKEATGLAKLENQLSESVIKKLDELKKSFDDRTKSDTPGGSFEMRRLSLDKDIQIGDEFYDLSRFGITQDQIDQKKFNDLSLREQQRLTRNLNSLIRTDEDAYKRLLEAVKRGDADEIIAMRDALLESSDLTLNQLSAILKDLPEELGRRIQSEFKALGTEVAKRFQEGLKGDLASFFKGEITFKEFGTRIADSFTSKVIESFSGQLIDSLFRESGLDKLFAEIFTGQFKLGDIVGSLGGLFKKPIEAITNIFDTSTKEASSVAATSIAEAGSTVAEGVTEGGFSLLGSLNTFAKFIGDGLSTVGTALLSGLTTVINLIKTATSAGGGGAFSFIGSFFGFASGGFVSGPGSGTSDDIFARLSNGEYVVNAAATKRNRGLLEAINSGRVPRFAEGGIVGSSTEGDSQSNSETLTTDQFNSINEKLSMIYQSIVDLTSLTADSASSIINTVITSAIPMTLQLAFLPFQIGGLMVTTVTVPLMTMMVNLYAALATQIAAGSFFSSGGYVKGPGSGTSDSIFARLSNGEYVINAASTKENLPLLEAINSGRIPKFATGGLVGVGNSTMNSSNIGSSISSDRSNARNNSQQVFNINITGDISDQTKKEIYQMLPQIANGVNAYNKEKGIRR
jgi:tape measure domain-containing protein